MRIFVTILSLCCSYIADAQSVRIPVSSAYQLLNAYSKNQADVFSFTHNTAALAQHKGFSAGAYGENRFLTGEINQYTAVAAIDTDKGNFGVQADYFGYTQFSEYQFGLAYGRSLGNNLDIGAQFNYYAYRIPAYPQSSALTFQLGLIARLSDAMSVGLQIYNPVGGYLSGTKEEKLSSVYQFGVAYEPVDNVIVSATLEKEESKQINVTGGVFYQFDHQFFARAGIRTQTNTPFAAAGIAFSELRLDLSVSHHPQLGFSPGIMIIYQPAKK